MMKIVRLKPAALFASLIALSGTPALANQTSTVVKATVNGVDQRTHLDCEGGEAEVSGTDNEVHITGNCRHLDVHGVDNKVIVAMAPNGVISVTGTDNQVRWTAPGKSTVRRTVRGVDNQVVRAQQ